MTKTVDDIINLIKGLKIPEGDSSTQSPTGSIVFNNPYIIGHNYLIRTVTHIYVGKLIGFGSQEIVLTECSWVADTGRFNEVFTNGLEAHNNSEIEPIDSPMVGIGRGAIVDFAIYSKDLPTKVK